jgi:hypothetical protein
MAFAVSWRSPTADRLSNERDNFSDITFPPHDLDLN